MAIERAAALSVLIAALLMTILGCGVQTAVHTITAAPAGQRGSRQARLGDTLHLNGNRGESLAVSVDRIIDPLRVGPGDPELKDHQRYLGILVSLKNIGTVPYSDAPANDASLFSDARGQAIPKTVSGGPCRDLDSAADIAPGESRKRCIVFEMPPHQTPKTLQFRLDSGFADQTGEWRLGPAFS